MLQKTWDASTTVRSFLCEQHFTLPWLLCFWTQKTHSERKDPKWFTLEASKQMFRSICMLYEVEQPQGVLYVRTSVSCSAILVFQVFHILYCKSFLVLNLSGFVTVAERAQCAVNRKNTCKLRQFDNMLCKCSQHNQIKKCIANTHHTTKQRNVLQIKFFIWLCCEHLQSVSLFGCVKMFSWFAGAFSICMCFLKLQRVELSRPPYFVHKLYAPLIYTTLSTFYL